MSHKYESKLDALLTGLFYVGRPYLYLNKKISCLEDLLKEPEIKIIKGVDIEQFVLRTWRHNDSWNNKQ